MLSGIWEVCDPTSVVDLRGVLLGMNGVSVDRLRAVLASASEDLMSLVASCKPGTGLTVGPGSGERLISKYPVLGLCTLVTIPRYPCLSIPDYDC